MTTTELLILLILFQVKHLIADFFLQTVWMIRGKANYGGAGGIVHATVHGLMTAAVLLMCDVASLVVLTLSVAELIVHYHIDWLKEQVMQRTNWPPTNKYYWFVTGTDQAAHQATYLAIAAYLI
jgi:hypothetical protein